MINTEELKQLLHLAESTALLAGRRLKVHQQDWAKIVVNLDRDVKIKADKEAEELILTQLKAATSYPILTEETGWHRKAEAQPVWIVDPLDGSFNYHQDIPFCCVAIGLVVNNEPILGVVYDFNHDELFSGAIGLGACVNYIPIKVSAIQERRSAVLNTGFPARRDYSPEAITAFFKEAQGWRKVRMLGSAALALAYVAAGRADAYREHGTMFWDVAAGAALVTAAGGKTLLEGDIFNSPINAFASNGVLK